MLFVVVCCKVGLACGKQAFFVLRSHTLDIAGMCAIVVAYALRLRFLIVVIIDGRDEFFPSCYTDPPGPHLRKP